MIEEVGIVVELKDRLTARVMCKKSSLCDNCATHGSCALGEDGSARFIIAQNRRGATVGDRVRIATSTASFLQSSFLLYIVPLIALVIGAVVGKLVGEHLVAEVDANLLSAVFGVFFMIGSFVILRVGTSTLAQENYMPKIVDILSAEE